MDPEEIDIDERQEARNKLKERFGQNARTGGKGMIIEYEFMALMLRHEI
jgi:hypothetical protein